MSYSSFSILNTVCRKKRIMNHDVNLNFQADASPADQIRVVLAANEWTAPIVPMAANDP